MQKKTRGLCLLGLGLVVATAAIAGSGSPKFLRAPSAKLDSPTGKFAANANSIVIPGVVVGWN